MVKTPLHTTRWGGGGIWEGSFGCAFFLRRSMCAEGMGCERRWVRRDFTEGALTISAGGLFQNETARIVKANWRQSVQHRC